MAIYICEKCGANFKRAAAGDRKIRFCSQNCYHGWNRSNGSSSGRFQKGMMPWNNGTKGVMKINSGSFKKGAIPLNKHQIGDIVQRTNAREGKPRMWIKVADNGGSSDWKLMAVVVWEKNHGQLPKGMVVHHKDRNQLNDDISNLQALTRADHLKEHRGEHKKSGPAYSKSSQKFAGSGTTAAVAKKHSRNSISIDVRQSQCDIITQRISEIPDPLF